MTPRRKRILAIVVPLQFVLARLAWRDLARRPSSQIRGPKTFWRVFVSLNPGNSIIYWAIGRRRASA